MIAFDDSLWPLVVVKFVGTSSDQEFDEYLEKLTKYLHRGEKIVVIYESSEMKDSPIEHRQRQIEWLQTNDALIREWMLGTVFVVSSPVLRLAVNVVQMLSKPPCPHFVASGLQPALVWAADRFRTEGFSLPSLRIRTQHGLVHPQATR